ncbi:hypothetical protein WEI85_00075 [Actinomycetes bacterium KLBMP 9797]
MAIEELASAGRTILHALGPQRRGESGLPARVRFHQSWFRHHVLGLEAFGSTPSHAGERALGSILAPADARRGFNFVASSARALFRYRRQQGWGVDPIRCTSHLTSSQALTLNLFGPLWSAPRWAARLMSTLLNLNVRRISGFDIEYAPQRRSAYLGDMTRIDGWLRLDTDDGPVAVVVEVKYVDRFNSRYIDPAERQQYRALANRTQLWDLDNANTRARSVNQLLRCHALGASTWLTEHPYDVPPRLLVIHHPDDRVAGKTVAAYREVLRHTDLLVTVSLDRFCQELLTSARGAAQRGTAERLLTRYVAHELSEDLWREYLAARDAFGRV